MSKRAIITGNNMEISDGYHTMSDIYKHRNYLFILLCLNHVDQCVWAYHEEWDSIILVWNSDNGQISYHVKTEMKPLFGNKIKCVNFGEHGWDRHTSTDVIERLVNNCILKK